MKTVSKLKTLAWSGLALSWLLLATPVTHAAPPASAADRAHARALASFRQGRFPEAYGRFIELAAQGHVASARYALWMCEQGPTLFGKDWDCTPQEAEDWAQLAGVAAPSVSARQYATGPGSARHAARR